jgi:hypothetical protein
MASNRPLASMGSLFRASLAAICCAIMWSGTAVAGPAVGSPEYVCPYCKPQPLRCSSEMSGMDCFSCGEVTREALRCNPVLKSECPASVEHRKDKNGKCCYPEEMTCDKCHYTKQECEWTYGCNTSVKDLGCGCGKGTQCYDCAGIPHGTARNDGCGCGAGRGCYGCDFVPNSGKVDEGCGCGQGRGCLEKACSFNWGCQDPGPGCNPAFSDPSRYCPGNGTIPHNGTLYKITHMSYQRGTGYLWSTNPNGEQLSCFEHSISNYKCNNGNLVPQ